MRMLSGIAKSPLLWRAGSANLARAICRQRPANERQMFGRPKRVTHSAMYTDPQIKTYKRLFSETKRKHHRAIVTQIVSGISLWPAIMLIELSGSNIFCIGITVILGVVLVGSSLFAHSIWHCPGCCASFRGKSAPQHCWSCGLELS
jgi:rubrerythrin